MFFDPMYFVFLAPGLLLSAYAAFKVKSTFAKYSSIPTSSSLNGAQVAEAILRQNNINDVTVEPVSGHLSDHYDPRSKVLRLSPEVYDGRSMSALGVAAHEVGHAIQDFKGYAPLKFRSGIVPIVGFAAPVSTLMIFGSLALGGASTVLGSQVGWAGLAIFGLTTVFSLVTLPVEFDASSRALATLQKGAYLSPEEVKGARKVLNAAALTYVAAAIISIATLLYQAYMLGFFGGSSRDE
jgi:uncharacterized protein